MTTVICPRCGATLTVEAEVSNAELLICSVCNKTFSNPLIPSASKLKKRKRNLIIIVSIIILSWLNYTDIDTADMSKYTVTKDTYAATSEDAWNELSLYGRDRDLSAIQKMCFSGKVVPLDKGEEVYLVSSGFTYRIVRRKGSTQKLWIASGIIKQ